MNDQVERKWYLKYKWLLVAGLVAVYLGLVLASVNRSSVWHDEGYTAVIIENNYSGIIERTALDVHPPLYYLLLKTWSLVFGEGVMVLRLFSAVCMVGAIIVTWRIVRKLYGERAGLIALAGMSIGPFLVRYGQEMRMYGLAALLASLSTYIYMKFVTDRKTSRWWYLAYGVLIAAGVYTQYFFVIVPAVHLSHQLLTAKRAGFKDRIKALKPYLLSFVVFLALFGPWLPTVKNQFSEVQGSFWIGPVSVETLTSTPIAMTVLKKQYQMTGGLAVVAVSALVVTFFALRKVYESHRDSESRLLQFSVLLPPILLFLLSLPPLQPSYQDRYMSFMAPIFYSLLALGVAVTVGRRIRWLAAGVLVALLTYGQVNNFVEGNSHGWQPSPYFTINQIVDQIDTNDPIYSTSLWTFFDMRTTIRDRDMQNQTKILLNQYPAAWKGNWSAIYERPDLIATNVNATDRFWLVDEAAAPQYNGSALNGYEVGKTFTAGYAKLTEYVKAN